MMKACLIGAGASYGYGQKGGKDDLSEVFLPPTSYEILNRAVKSGLLAKDSYPFLYEAVQEYFEIDVPLSQAEESALRCDIEEFLEWVIENADMLVESAFGQGSSMDYQ